jgi:putative Holliday junction resolvase
MRYLGIDYGKKRVGIALSDEGAQFALPKAVIPASPDLVNEIEKIAKQAGVKTIVIGESRDYGGRANPLLQNIDVLVRILKDKGFNIILEQEYGSSVEAEKFQGKNEMSDASAASIILQRFLDKETNKR